jgi:8-oxo-dGTP pyrophosphatase MutT (NUDIX family)
MDEMRVRFVANAGAHGKVGKKGKGAVRHEHSAGFILFRETPEGGRKFLLLDYGRHWDYAKGHLEKGESPWRAAVRELREETGIKQVDRVGRFQRDMSYSFFSPRKGYVIKVVTFFLGRTRQEDIKVSDEHEGFAWLSYEDAMERLTFDNARDMLRAAVTSMSQRKAT